MSAPSIRPDPDAGSYELLIQIEELRERVLRLEERAGIAIAAVPQAAPAVPAPELELPSGIVPVLGRMLLAIAGAYVLRALTEWGTLPPVAGVVGGLIYAGVWLGVAWRFSPEAEFAASVATCTAVLITGPLLWEATARLSVMPSQAGAAAIVALGLASIALGKRHRIAGGIGVASSLAMASGLLLARNDIVPFTLGLLTIGAALEVATWLGVDSRVRSAGAVVATGSVLLFSWLMSGRPGMPEAWVPASHFALLASQLALPSLYVATAVNQAVLRRKTLTFGEILRAAGALGVGIGGAAWVFHENRTVMLGLGIASLIAGIGGYTISFRLFERNNKRNFRALATFGLFLVLTGMSLAFSRAGFWMFACVCAIACCQVAKMFRLPTLALHGMAYLLLGAAIAGVSVRLLQVLFGDPVGSVDWLASFTVLGTAVLCEAGVVKVAESGVGRWRTRISSLGIVAQIAGIVAALAVYGLWRIMPGIVPIDTLATVVLTGSSLTLAWAAMQWERRELVWLLCGGMALGAYKLATRDFMNEHNLPLVVSLFCYGGALILLPRMLRGANAAKGTS